MGVRCKERYNKDEKNELEGLHQKPDQMEETRWEGQNFSEVVAPQEEEEEQEQEEEEEYSSLSNVGLTYFNIFYYTFLKEMRNLMNKSWYF
jgi:hypothetical protein